VRFDIGTEVRCLDGVCGVLRRVVVNPAQRVATHLVVEPRHRTGLGRLVPIDLVDASGPDGSDTGIRLACSHEKFDRLEFAEQILVPGGPGADMAGEQLMTVPFYGLDPDTSEVTQEFGGNADQPYLADAIPAGEVEVSPDERVHATDGIIGRIRGVAVDRADHRVTHLLLHEGHLWGKRELAVPMSNVVQVDAGIRLNISKAQVADLPAL
jgi:hypothetical protein